jgi:hypothetical protein
VDRELIRALTFILIIFVDKKKVPILYPMRPHRFSK